MRLSIRWKLILSIGLPTLTIYVVVLSFNYFRLTQFARDRLEQHLTLVAEHHATRFDGRFAAIAEVAKTTARFLETDPNLKEEQLYKLLEYNVQQDPLIYGGAIAFEPDAYEPGRRLYSPYVCREGEGLKRLEIGGQAYDYLNGQWQWYSVPRATGKATWTDPYFDRDAGNVVMCTFAQPFFADGKMRGVVTVDIPVLALQEQIMIKEQEYDKIGYAILSRSGAFLSHPKPSLVAKQTVFEIAEELGRRDFAQLGRTMIEGGKGVVEMRGMANGPDLLPTPEAHVICYAPISSTGWSFAAAVPLDQAVEPARSALLRSASLLTFGLLVIVAILLIASVRITRPLVDLADIVHMLARGDLDAPQALVKSKDEIGQLAQAFNHMIRDLRAHVAALTKETAARQAVESELGVAREIQQSLLPRTFPPYPHRPEFDLHAVNLPARSVAGDFFDFYLMDHDVLMLVIADVAGKGVPAALFMAVSRTVLRNLALQGLGPAEILNRANEILRQDNDRGLFVTLFIGHYYPATGRLVYANAAHPPPMCVTSDGTVTRVGEVTGTLLGVFNPGEAPPYEQNETQLNVGDTMVLFTDGVPEARSTEGEFYREERFKQWLSAHCGEEIGQLCTAARDEIVNFQSGEPADDVTILMVRRRQ